MKVIAILGVPGAGKSTLMKAILKHFDITEEHLKKDVFLVNYHQKDNFYVLGKYEKDDKFPGTDKLSMATQPECVKFLDTLPDNSIVLFEGDRLCTSSFLENCVEKYDTKIIYIYTNVEERNRRFTERGSNQDPTWLAGRDSKVGNILTNFALMSSVVELKNDNPTDFKNNVETMIKLIGNNMGKFLPSAMKTPEHLGITYNSATVYPEDFPYKYSEDKILLDLENYIKKTYGEHYSSQKNKVQTLEYIMEQFDDGADFLKGCALKYITRYGKKDGKNQKDLWKAIHYIIVMLHYDFYNRQGDAA